MCSYFRSVSQPKCRAVDKLVDEFVDGFCSEAGLKVTHTQIRVYDRKANTCAMNSSSVCTK